MSLLEDLKKMADRNGDGRLSKEDLDSLKGNDGDNNQWIEKLKEKADHNGDGKIGKEDLSGLTDSLGGMKNKLFGK